MAINAGTVAAALTLDTGKFDGALKQSRTLMETFKSSGATMGDKLQAVSGLMTSTGKALTMTLTPALVGVGTLAVKTFTSFDDAMRQVRATMAASEEDTEKLTAAAKKYGAETSFSASQAAEALNYLALAGYDADKAISALPKVLQLAQAGGLELGYASDLVTDSMSALGLEMSALTGFSDQLARTAQKSNTNISQLGQAILTVGGTAKNLAGGTVELNTELGILADSGIKSAEGGTHLRNVILSLTNPTAEGARLLKKYTAGVYDAEGRMRSLDVVFQELKQSMSGMTDAQKQGVINEIFNKTDLAAVQALLAGCGERYAELSGYITDSAGAAEQMAATMEGGIGGALRELQSAAEGAAIEFGEALAPTIKSVAEWVATAGQKFAGLSDGMQQTIAKVAAITAAVGPLLVVGGKIVGLVAKIGPAIKAIGAAGAGAAGPVGWIALAVTALIGLDKWATRSRSSTDKLRASLKADERTQSFAAEFAKGSESYTHEVEVDVEVKKNYAEEASKLYSDIFTWLTDGMPDTEQQKKDVAAKVQEYYDSLISEVNLSESTELASLKAQFDNGFIDYDTYNTRTAEVIATAQTSRTELGSLCDETLKFVDEYSGAPASVVSEAYTELDTLQARAEEILGTIKSANAELDRNAERSINLTKAGATRSIETYGTAFTATREEFDTNRAEIEASAEEKAKEIYDIWESAYNDARDRGDQEGMDRANARHREMLDEIESDKGTQIAEMESAYIADIQELFGGIAKAYPEQFAQLQDAMQKLNLRDEARKLLTDAEGGALLTPEMLTDDLKTEIDIADILEFTGGDPALVSEAIKTALPGLVTGQDMDIEGMLEETLNGTELGGVFSQVVEQGLLNGVEGVDVTTAEGQLRLLTGSLVEDVNMDMQTAINSMSESGQAGASLFTAGAADGITEETGTVTSAISKFTASIKKAASSGGLSSSAGSALSGAMVGGIVSGLGSSARLRVMAASVALARAAITAANQVLEINSPSKAFKRIGLSTGEGFVMGVDESVFRAKNAMRRMVDPSGIGGGANGTSAGAAGAGGGVQYNITVQGATIRSEDEARDLMRRATQIKNSQRRGYGL